MLTKRHLSIWRIFIAFDMNSLVLDIPPVLVFFPFSFLSFFFSMIFGFGGIYHTSRRDLKIVLNSLLRFFLTETLGVRGVWVSSSLSLSLVHEGKSEQALWRHWTSWLGKVYLLARILQGLQTLEMRTGIWVSSKRFNFQKDTSIQVGGKGWVLGNDGSPSLSLPRRFQNWSLSRGRKKMGGGEFPQQWPPVLECWAAIASQGDVQLEIFERILIPGGKLQKGFWG